MGYFCNAQITDFAKVGYFAQIAYLIGYLWKNAYFCKIAYLCIAHKMAANNGIGMMYSPDHTDIAVNSVTSASTPIALHTTNSE